MKAKIPKKKSKTKIFDSIRKPIAPPTKTLGTNKPKEKAIPSLRKAKHRKDDKTDDFD